MSSAFATLELRWFFDGACPQPVKDWYRDLARMPRDAEAPTRSDVYLLLDGRDDVGLKLRKRKLQLKTRDHQATFPSGQVEGQIEGLSETWRRHSWILAGETPEALNRLFLAGPANGRRCNLSKRRLQTAFALDLGSPLEPEPKTRREPGFITIELAEIEKEDEGCWSLCLETVPGKLPLQSFEGAVMRLLKDYPGPALSADSSFGYPAFLRKFGSAFIAPIK